MRASNENKISNIISCLKCYQRVWLLVCSLLYIAIVYCLYSSHVLNAFIQVDTGYKILWNYFTAYVLIQIMFLTTSWAKNRSLPSLPRTQTAGLILCSSLLISTILLILFWKFVVVSPPPFIMAFKQDLNNALNFLPYFSKMRIENAIFTLPATAFAVGISIWRIKGWRRYTFKLGYRDILVVLMLIVMSTFLSFFRDKIFCIHSSNILPQVSFDALLGLFAQFFVNGLMEETFDRGYIFPQLLAFFHSPWISMWVTVFLFDASHLPSLIIGQNIHLYWWQWILFLLFPNIPTGWFFGLIYFRLRTVIPGALYHTYTTLWTFPFT